MSFYSIPATIPFADCLAQYCDDLAREQQIPLSTIKIFLPTRRGVRTLQESFLQLSGGKPRILPIMQSIGDVDLEEASFINDIDIPPAIDSTHRQIILAQLLERAWPHDYNYLQALSIASDLGQLIDQIHTEELNINNLNDVMSVNEFAQYWEMTTSFLTLLLDDVWPKYLSEQGMVDIGYQRKLRINALTNFYKNNPPKTPVIMAGSTGSIPSTRKFIQTIGECDQGHVILPALDMIMGEKEWFNITAGHPQYLLKNLLTSCHKKRDDVIELGEKTNENRLYLMSEMMRPAVTTDQWKTLSLDDQKSKIMDGLNGVVMCEADNDHHESMVIALSMLEIAADPDQTKTAILITPNRYLAMRVQANLKQWGIDIDDSGGTSLTNTPIGQFALGVIQSYKNNQIHPVPFLSTLKNLYMGNEIEKTRSCVRAMERELFRGVRPYGDFESLLDLSERNKDFINQLSHKFSVLKPYQTGVHNVSKLMTAHITILENLANAHDETGAERLWKGEDGEVLSDMFKSLLSCADTMPHMTLNDYGEFIQSMVAKHSFTARYGKHPRLAILGQIESRMIKADRVILSGLNEGVWPADSGFDAWMSRPMRGHFGLPSLEQKTTLSAHDFACGFCASEVFITRSKKSDGQPTLPSRWLERLQTVLQAANIDEKNWPQKNGQPYLQWAYDLRRTGDVHPISRPAPKPEKSIRPTEFSVTEIEKWMRDPYWIYAKKILRLRQLDQVDADITVADRGTLIHDAMDQFTNRYTESFLPETAYDDLINIGDAVFKTQSPNPEIHGLWWPRFTKTAQWFINHERDWRTETNKIHSEIKGSLSIAINDQEFKLSGKADRIETRIDQSIAIIDYKTGAAPASGDVNNGLASQLPLEALILDQNGFENIKSSSDYKLQYWVLNGSGDGGSVSIAQGAKGQDTIDLMTQAHDGLISLITLFDDTHIPYIGSPDPARMIKIEYNDYAHLERISEWMVTEDADD